MTPICSSKGALPLRVQLLDFTLVFLHSQLPQQSAYVGVAQSDPRKRVDNIYPNFAKCSFCVERVILPLVYGGLWETETDGLMDVLIHAGYCSWYITARGWINRLLFRCLCIFSSSFPCYLLRFLLLPFFHLPRTDSSRSWLVKLNLQAPHLDGPLQGPRRGAKQCCRCALKSSKLLSERNLMEVFLNLTKS